MKSAKLEGVVTILVTPFDNQGHVDTESLRRLVEFNIEASVNGIGIAMGSEIFRLNEEEFRIERIPCSGSRRHFRSATRKLGISHGKRTLHSPSPLRIVLVIADRRGSNGMRERSITRLRTEVRNA